MKKYLLIGMIMLLCVGCGVQNTRPEKPTVHIAEEFLEMLKEQQQAATAESTEVEEKSTEEIEESVEVTQEDTEEVTTETPTTQAPLKQPEFVISKLTEQDKLVVIERTIGTVLQCIPDKIYYSRASFEKTSEFAIQYLQRLVFMYENEYAVHYGDVTQTSYKRYVSWSREKVGYYLDILYGGQFSEYELVCDGDALLYYNEQYYIGIPEKTEDYHVTVQYDKEDVDRSDFVYIMLEEDDGRERRSGHVAISVMKEALDYADMYIFEMIIEEE